jgi:hypothetical protein
MFKYQKPRKKNHNRLERKGKIENINGGDYTTNARKASLGGTTSNYL